MPKWLFMTLWMIGGIVVFLLFNFFATGRDYERGREAWKRKNIPPLPDKDKADERDQEHKESSTDE